MLFRSKRMLAYSSIAHAGYLMVAVGAATTTSAKATDAAFGAISFYLLAYTLMTMGSFGVLILLSRRGAHLETINDLKGLARRDPFAAYMMLIFMLSLGGIPPTMGFLGKWFIFNAVLQAGQVGMAIALAFASIISIYYYLRIVWMMCFQEPDTEEKIPYASVPLGVQTTIIIAGAASLILGLLPGLANLFLRAGETVLNK